MPLAAGVALVAAGLLGLHLSGSGASTVATIQPTRAELRATGLKAPRLFAPYKALAVYTYRAPDFKRTSGGAFGIFSDVLVVLGTRQGAMVAVSEAMGPPGGPGVISTSETGWQTVLPPAPRPVKPETLARLPVAERGAITQWAASAATSLRQLTIWPFPSGALAVTTTDGGQSAAAVFQGGKEAKPLWTLSAPALQGGSTTRVVLKPRR